MLTRGAALPLRLGAVLGVAALIGVGDGGPAAAAPIEHSSGAGLVVDGRPTAVAVADGTGELASWSASLGTGGSGGSSWTCTYHDLRAMEGWSDAGFTIGIDAAVVEEGQPYALVCHDDAGEQVHAEIVVWEPGDPLGSLLAADRARDEASAALDLPAPLLEASPALTSDHHVGLATWLWDDSGWSSQAATAAVAGVSATVVAEPVALRWDPGDGAPAVECVGAGIVFAPGAAEGCTHTWQHRSTLEDPGGTFEMVVELSWSVAWSATDGSAGELGTLTTEAREEVRVLETQSVIDY